MKYDYLIVGAGLYGAVAARCLTDKGYKCLVIDKRDHIGGNSYTKNVSDIEVHWYGAHIFHTSDKRVWEFANRYADFDEFIHSPMARYHEEMYNLPFNMNTFHQIWSVETADEAKAIIDSQIERSNIEQITNLEEQALSMVGQDIYEKLIKGYTEKQWGRECRELPAEIIKRLPLRFTYDNNYYNDIYQAIPRNGYTAMIENILDGIEVKLNCVYKDFIENKEKCWDKIIYTGMIDEYYDYVYGPLEYRSLRFEHTLLEGQMDYQGYAVVNYTDRDTPFTRIIEHKYFAKGNQPDTFITKEYPVKWEKGMEPYYPVNDEKNTQLLQRYQALADKENDVIFGGRLGSYKYYDMDKVIAAALEMTDQIN